jgi:hypothetical protein
MEEKKQNNIITVRGVDYMLKPGMKAIVVFEKIAEKAFEIKTTTDILVYIYSAIIAGTSGAILDFDVLLDAMDEDPDLIKRATEIVLPRTAAEKLVQLANEGGAEPKKD